MAKKKTEVTEVDAQINEKVVQISKLFKELEGLAAQSETPTHWPSGKGVGYAPQVWVDKYNAVVNNEDLTDYEREDLLDRMMQELPYPNGVEFGDEIEAGPVWAPSTC